MKNPIYLVIAAVAITAIVAGMTLMTTTIAGNVFANPDHKRACAENPDADTNGNHGFGNDGSGGHGRCKIAIDWPTN